MKRARKDLIVTVHSDDEDEGEGSGSDDLELAGLEEALDLDGVVGEQPQALAVVPMVTGGEDEEDAAAAPGFSLKEGENEKNRL
jgi:hypothetical protein